MPFPAIGAALGAIGSSLGGAAGIGAAAAKGLGSLALGAAGTHIGNKLAQSAYEDQYGFLTEQGLTPQEIAGSGGYSGPGNPGATLGNNASEMARIAIQQEFEAQQRELDRQTMERGQDASMINTERSASATEASAAMAAGTAANRLDFERQQYEEVTFPQAVNNLITSSPEFVMKRLLLTMGEDNLMTSMRAIDSGIDLNDPSTITPGKVRELARYIAAQNSTVFQEAMGAAVTAEHGREFLGNQTRRQMDEILGKPGDNGGTGTGGGTGEPLRITIP